MPGGDRGTPISRFAYLDRAAHGMGHLLCQREAGVTCSLCGRRSDRFRVGAGLDLLCVECAPDDGGDWCTVERVFANFVSSVTLLRNAHVTLLGLHFLARREADLAGCIAFLPVDHDRLMDDCRYLLGLVAHMRQTAAACGCPLPEDAFFQAVANGGWAPA